MLDFDMPLLSKQGTDKSNDLRNQKVITGLRPAYSYSCEAPR